MLNKSWPKPKKNEKEKNTEQLSWHSKSNSGLDFQIGNRTNNSNDKGNKREKNERERERLRERKKERKRERKRSSQIQN